MTIEAGWSGQGAHAVRLTAAVALFGAALWALAPATFVGLNVFDEGFIASGALEILHGALPMRDFFVIYGPGAYYMNAAAFALFGEDLAVLRGLHLMWMAFAASLIGMLAWRFTGRAGMAPWVAAVFVAFASLFAPTPGYAAIPAALLLMVAAIELAQARFGPKAVGLWRVSLWLGLTTLLRWDFGVLGGLALAGAWLLSRPATPGRGLLQLLVPAAVLTLLFFMPFVWLGGPERWWDEIFWFHLHEFKDWRGLEFIGPHRALLRHAEDPVALGAELMGWLAFLCPFVLALFALPLAGRRLWRKQAGETDLLAAALALVDLALLNQQRVRTGLPQGFPALMVALPLGSYLAVAWPHRLPRFMLGLLAVAVLGASLPHAMRLRLMAHPVELARAGHLQVLNAPAERAQAQVYAQLVSRLRELVPPGQRLYSGVMDTSRLWVNDAMLYFLVDRRPATRWIEMEPGLVNAPSREPAVVAEIERHAPPWIVLWDNPSREPNRSSVGHGLSLLDRLVRERYVLVERWGDYRILQRR